MSWHLYDQVVKMIRSAIFAVFMTAVIIISPNIYAQNGYSPGQTFPAQPGPTAAPSRGQNFYGTQQQPARSSVSQPAYVTPAAQQQLRGAQRPVVTPYNMDRTPVKRSSESDAGKKSKPAAAQSNSRSRSDVTVTESKKPKGKSSSIRLEEVSSSKAEVSKVEAPTEPSTPEVESSSAETAAIETPEVKLAIVDTKNKLTFSSHKTGKKWIALTYDDGPNPNLTPKLMEYLTANNVPATFYMLGEMVKAHPDLVKALADSGFELANHTYSHPDLRKQSPEKILKELQDTHDLIKEASGVDVLTMRPPYGARNSKVDEVCEKMGYKIILWDVDTEDWRNRSTDAMLSTIIKQTGDGSIILMHDRKHKGRETVLDVTRKAVDHFRAKGYTFVTVGQLLSLTGNENSSSGTAEAGSTTTTLARLGAFATSSSLAVDRPLPTPAVMTPASVLP